MKLQICVCKKEEEKKSVVKNLKNFGNQNVLQY